MLNTSMNVESRKKGAGTMQPRGLGRVSSDCPGSGAAKKGLKWEGASAQGRWGCPQGHWGWGIERGGQGAGEGRR